MDLTDYDVIADENEGDQGISVGVIRLLEGQDWLGRSILFGKLTRLDRKKVCLFCLEKFFSLSAYYCFIPSHQINISTIAMVISTTFNKWFVQPGTKSMLPCLP